MTLSGAVALAAESQPQAEPGIYVVQAGETCLKIAKKVWPNDPDALDKLHTLNQMGPLPHNLVGGQKLHTAPTTADAQITFLKPDVNVRKAGKPDWLAGKVGQDLFNLDQVTTLAGAAAEVVFRDRSSLQIDQNALVTIYAVIHGVKSAERSGKIELVQGDLRLKLASMRGESGGTMDVNTPSAQVAARSATMLVGVDEKKMSRVSVFDGTAAVAAAGQKVDVKRGFGTRVGDGAAPEAPQPLPAAPAWASGGTNDVIMALTNAGASVTLRWKDVASAVRYRVEVATDDRFNTRLTDTQVKAGGPLQFEMPTLSLGRYYARVSAYNAAGLAGAASPTKRLDIASLKYEAGGPGAKAGTLRGAVEIRLRLPEGAGLSGVVDDTPVGNPVRVTGLGHHTLKIVNAAGSVMNTFQCDVEKPLVKVEFVRGLKEVRVRFFDKAGKAIGLPDVPAPSLQGELGTAPIGELRPQAGNHEWRSAIAPYRSMSSQLGAAVTVFWNGQKVGGGHAEEVAQ